MSDNHDARDGEGPRMSREEIADYHARFISCNEGFAEPEGLIKPAPELQKEDSSPIQSEVEQ